MVARTCLAVLEAARQAEAGGEPWRTRLRLEEMRARLLAAGFAQVTLPEPPELDARYFGGRADGLHAPTYTRFASAST